jgi:hypothetical protein
MIRNLWILAVVCLAALPSTARATLIAVGDEFQLNAYTGNSSHPEVVPLPSGGFFVAWRRIVSPPPTGIFARILAADGTPIGQQNELQVNAYTYTADPAVAVDGEGEVVVSWARLGATGPETGIFARRFDSLGHARGAEFQVNVRTSSHERFSSVAAAPHSGFLVVWSSGDDPGNAGDILARRYDGKGQPAGDVLQVNVFTASTGSGAAVVARTDGSFVVVWANGDEREIVARVVDREGHAAGAELQVSTSQGPNFSPSLTTGPGDGFAVVWVGALDQILARRFDNSGNAIGSELQISTYTGGDVRRPDIAADSAGNFLVAWTNQADAYPEYADVLARRFDSTGLPLGTEFIVNTHTYLFQGRPAVAAQPDGEFLVVWESLDYDLEIIARRFAAPHTVIVPSDDVPLRIPDGGPGSAASILFGPDLLIADVNLVIERLPHACPSHLKVALASPSGTTVDVIEAFGIVPVARTRGFLGTILDDDAPDSLADGAPSFTGPFNVEHPSVVPMPLSVFDGENASGIWTLRISDEAADCAGELEAWSLEFEPVRCAGDCDRNGIVELADLVRGVGAALGTSSVAACVLVDGDRNFEVGIDELLLAVGKSISGCAEVQY